MNCPFCGKTFDALSARKSCQTCAIFGGCKKLKCPHCGYEMPPEPAWIRWIRSKFSGDRHD